jgi:hypothetical protein
LVFNRAAEKFRRQLVFQFFDAFFVRLAEEKTDHAVGEHAVNEIIDNPPQTDLAAELLERAAHGNPGAMELMASP